MFSKVLIANRGAIACRIIRTLKRLDIASVAVYSPADAESLHVQQADEAVNLHADNATDSYLNTDKIIAAARATGAEAIHPGYGFLSENAAFAERCEQEGIRFIGPTPSQIRQFGLKHEARELAAASHVPLVPGSPLVADIDAALAAAEPIGYPVMLKSTAGGGGIGMQVCRSADELRAAFDTVKRLGRNNFSHDGVFLEKYVARARHIEVQLAGDGHGKVVALGERDCSLQRRNQKVVEETPAPNLPTATRDAMVAAALRLGEAVNYRSAGTVEFIYDADTDAFYFLEVNTRLQVEHGVTEAVTGVDLVEWMLRIAADDSACLHAYQYQPQGHAVQMRIYAEDPGSDFKPSSGLLTEVVLPEAVRCDTWVETGTVVPPYYDPMLAKVIAHGTDRASAMEQLRQALTRMGIGGIATNLGYGVQVLNDERVRAGEATTALLNSFRFADHAIEVMDGGTQTTVQDYPGRTGYWDIGVPPSGPMDALALQLGNRLLGNEANAAGLEATLHGPTLTFRCHSAIALTGAASAATLNDQPLPFYQVVPVQPGDELCMGAVGEQGLRTYLCVAGGIHTPRYLGSRATFTLGQFGGHGGRALRVGDLLPIEAAEDVPASAPLPAAAQPVMGNHHRIAVLYGPHGAPDFFTDGDIDTFFATDWKIHFNSSRTGVRLIGPKPTWARSDGGEAGLHPSNIHDNAYAVGAVDFTGDMPVILGPDGPSLGGFVCPVTIIKAELWKVGQLKPGDTVRFYPVSAATAARLETEQRRLIDTLTPASCSEPEPARTSPIVHRADATEATPAICYRASGDDNLLVEYGPLVLDLDLRFRVHALMQSLQQARLNGVLELTPGIRSLQIHYDPLVISQAALVDQLQRLDTALGDVSAMSAPSRIVHLPLSWDDAATRRAIDKYMTTVRPDAPWCPSNIEFIRRINGLDSIDEVKRIVFDASYLVMGLGDVYLGAPVATPLDPRHRLVTTKYNPARTWTPENAVGIGGAYLCVYGMEGPGGYQFVGRTLQMWNRFRTTPEFEQPWLLRFFDQIRFFPVSPEELLQIRHDFPLGKYRLNIEDTEFRLADYHRFLADNDASITAFRTTQRAAFAEERERWAAAGLDRIEDDPASAADDAPLQLQPHQVSAVSPVPGSIWQISAKPGQTVAKGEVVAVIESMKTEFPVNAPAAGTINQLLVDEGAQVDAGSPLLIIDTKHP